MFTPQLADAYKNLSDDMKKNFDIVFISLDKEQSQFDEYFKDMPWKALPYVGKSIFSLFSVEKEKTKLLPFDFSMQIVSDQLN